MRYFIALLALAGALVLTGCAPTKSVDVAVTGATLVPGTGNLFRFCDGSTLIYFTNRQGYEDDYEFVIYDGCSTDPAAIPRVGGE